MAQVMIVEPDGALAGLYGQALESRGHSVSLVTTAQDAVIAADVNKPDVVLLELQLTSHSGVEFLYEFRSYTDWLHVPVIIISNVPPAEFTNSSTLLGKKLGVIAYHYKPHTSLRTVLYAVENALANV